MRKSGWWRAGIFFTGQLGWFLHVYSGHIVLWHSGGMGWDYCLNSWMVQTRATYSAEGAEWQRSVRNTMQRRADDFHSGQSHVVGRLEFLLDDACQYLEPAFAFNVVFGGTCPRGCNNVSPYPASAALAVTISLLHYLASRPLRAL